MAEVTTTVTYLEMTAEPFLQVPPPSKIKLMLVRAENPTVGFYRYLYDAVGESFHWVDRKRLSDTDLAAIIQHEKVEVWVAYANGQPAGYFEIDARQEPAEVELQYLGLLPEFQRLGLGKWLLAEAIRACWARKPERVIVQTCTLDGPAALPLYQKMGFVPYGREEKVVDTGT
jgi:GNAT superfamily N-acetyltransferase